MNWSIRYMQVVPWNRNEKFDMPAISCNKKAAHVL